MSEVSETDIEIAELPKKIESGEATLVDKCKYQWLTQQDKNPSEAIAIPAQEILSASTEEYTDFLHFLNNLNDPNLIAQNIDVISQRFKSDIKQYSKKTSWHEREKGMDVGNETRKALWLIALDPEVKVDKKIIEDLYTNAFDTDRMVSHHAIEYLHDLMVIDNRNRPQGDEINIFGKYKNDLINKMVTPQEPGNYELSKRLIDVAWASFPQEIEGIMIDAFEKAQDETARKVIWNVCANREGLADAWKKLKSHAQLHEGFKEKLRLAEEAIGLEKVEQVHADLRDLYDQINFKDYKPNAAMNEEETELLYAQLHDRKKVLDIGAGTGRLMKSLSEKGLTVFGFDYVKSHAQQIKQIDPQANIAVASWMEMPYKDESFDGAYCAGRSILHNTTVEDMLDFLRESNRILTRDGKLIIDTPDPETGLYKLARDKFAAAMQNIGVEHFEDGVIYDSPDGKNFFNRFAPGEEQFKAIAFLAGFDAKVVERKNYNDTEGFTNTNIYWELTKTKKPESPQENMELIEKKMDAMHSAYTSAPPLNFTWL